VNDETPPTRAFPKRILLATDLSARCDRALGRAAQLAGEWHAELIALNVLDPAASPDQALAWAAGADDEHLLRIARQQLNRDLSELGVRASMRIARGVDVADAIRAIASTSHAGLVVTAVACYETLGRFLLGSTVERLARLLPQPLLVVRSRARMPYQRIVVATDFSDSSGHALQVATRLFPRREQILYHAYETPLSGLSDIPALSWTRRGIGQAECLDFLAAYELSAQTPVRPVVEDGAVESTLARFVRQHDIELVVIGAHGRGGMKNVLLGSTAAKLLEWLPCDVLVVRDPRSSGNDTLKTG
jgi:nucleotide-binding universal stress UspA family protein